MTKSDQELPQHGHWSLEDIESHIPEEPKFWADIALRKVVEAYKSRQAQVDQLRAEVDSYKNMMAQKMPTSFGHMKWACQHEGPAVCHACATQWREERDQLKAMAERLAGLVGQYRNAEASDLDADDLLADWKAYGENKSSLD